MELTTAASNNNRIAATTTYRSLDEIMEKSATSDTVILSLSVISVVFIIATAFYIFQPALVQKSFDEDNVIEENLTLKNDCSDEDCEHLLSLVIPAYNEEERLPPVLNEFIEYLHTNKDTLVQQCKEALEGNSNNSNDAQQQSNVTGKYKKPFQIIVVNDGSSDDTVKSTKNLLQTISGDLLQCTSIKILTFKQNSGKGAAVKAGMLRSSSSKLCLMVDADGATTFSSLHDLLNNLKSDPEARIAFGSRAHLQEQSKAKRSFMRTLLMNGFHFFVEFLVGSEIKDTQCGFKLFRGDVVQDLFGNLHLQRWAFDTELVVIAGKQGVGIVEVGVEW